MAVSGFMVCAAGRMIPAQAMMLGASAPATRGAFMSLNTAVQHLATGLAPMIAGAIIGSAAAAPVAAKIAAFDPWKPRSRNPVIASMMRPAAS